MGQFVMADIKRYSAPVVKRHSAPEIQPNTDMETIGSRMRVKRLELGLTQQELGDAVGLAKSTIRDIELGKSKSSTRLHAIAAVLGVTVTWLETGRGKMNASDADPKPLSIHDIDAATLARAMFWVGVEEDASSVTYQPLRRAARIIAMYQAVAANGGDLTAEQVISLVESARADQGDRHGNSGESRRKAS